LTHLSAQRKELRKEALRRLRDRRAVKAAAIVENAKDIQAAQNTVPAKKHPKFLLKIFPRLGRVASATEKLFWFGSHRFFLYCVEFCLFFTNVNISAGLAFVAFHLRDRAAFHSYVSGKNSAKFLMPQVGSEGIGGLSMRAPKGASKDPPKKPEESLFLLILALLMGILTLSFVLWRVAGIMKKYIFVLNNANLIPEHMTVETIRHINLKDAMAAETLHGGDSIINSNNNSKYYPMDFESDSEYETDNPDPEAEINTYRSMRRNLSNFIASEAETKNRKKQEEDRAPHDSGAIPVDDIYSIDI